MAIGVFMAGSNDATAVAILEPIVDDIADYVRQGALIATAKVMM